MPFPPTPYGGAGFNYGGGLLTPQGGGGFGGFSPLTQFGLGLLAQSGPSLTPQSPWSAIGRAGQFASEQHSQAQQQAMQNEYMREKLLDARQQREGIAGMQKFFADNPDALGSLDPALQAAFKYSPELATKAYVESVTNPAYQWQAKAAQQEYETGQLTALAKKGELAAGEADNALVYENAAVANDAIDYLKNLPGGGSLLVSPRVVKALRLAYEAGGLDPNTVGADVASVISSIPKDQWGNALSAAEAVEKSRSNVANMGASSNAGVLGLQTRLTGRGAGAGLDVQAMQFKSVLDASKKISDRVGWEVPEVDPAALPWRIGSTRATAPATPPAEADRAAASASLDAPRPVSYGVQNGQLVAQPAPVYTDMPSQPPSPAQPFNPNSNYVMEGPGAGSFAADLFGLSVPQMQNYAAPYIQQGSKAAAQAVEAAAPVVKQAVQGARRVGTVAYDALGRAVFRSKQEFDRMVKNGALVIPPEGLKAVIGGKSGTLYPE